MNNSYTQLKTGTIEDGKNQMVFAIIYTKEAKPYINYDQVPQETRMLNIPYVLMQLRWDGMFGFPGGFVDEGENLKTAILREMLEELCFVGAESKLEPFMTFATDNSNIHSFAYEVTEEELKKIQKDSMNAEHFLAENQGSVLIQIGDFGKGKGFPAFLKNNFAATAGLELKSIVEKKDLLSINK